MKGQLWYTCKNVTPQQAAENRARFVMRKIEKRFRQEALCGVSDFTFSLDQIPQDVRDLIEARLISEGMTPLIAGEVWTISCKPLPHEMLPLLTARELVQMGYNPAEGNLFERILEGLRKAIKEGQIRGDYKDGQIAWVKEKYTP